MAIRALARGDVWPFDATQAWHEEAFACGNQERSTPTPPTTEDWAHRAARGIVQELRDDHGTRLTVSAASASDAAPKHNNMKLTHHGPQDYQSLLMHQEAVRMVEADPSLSDRLLKILANWDTHVCSRSRPLRERWVQIVRERNWSLAIEESELANQLRQASPMAGLLPSSVRFGIIRQVRAEKEQQHAQTTRSCACR